MTLKFLDLSKLKLVRKKNNKDEERYICPFCKERRGTPDLKGHLFVSHKLGLFHCFRCDASSRTTGYYLKSYLRIRRQIQIKSESPANKPICKPDDYYSLFKSKNGFFPIFRRYAKGRGIVDEDIDKYDIGFTTDLNDPLFGRLIFCSYEEKSGDLEFLQGRWVLDLPNQLRYYSLGDPPLFKSFKGKVDYGIIVEGIFDMIKASRFLPSAALLGDKINEKQRKQIKNSFKKVLLALDHDAMAKVIPCLRQLGKEGIEVYPTFLPAKDFSEMEDNEVQKILRKHI